jgi:hypothetical protein
LIREGLIPKIHYTYLRSNIYLSSTNLVRRNPKINKKIFGQEKVFIKVLI